MSNLHPIFAQALAPWTPPSEADLLAADLRRNLDKINWHRRNSAAALACQIAADDKIDRRDRGNEK